MVELDSLALWAPNIARGNFSLLDYFTVPVDCSWVKHSLHTVALDFFGLTTLRLLLKVLITVLMHASKLRAVSRHLFIALAHRAVDFVVEQPLLDFRMDRASKFLVIYLYRLPALSSPCFVDLLRNRFWVLFRTFWAVQSLSIALVTSFADEAGHACRRVLAVA